MPNFFDNLGAAARRTADKVNTQVSIAAQEQKAREAYQALGKICYQMTKARVDAKDLDFEMMIDANVPSVLFGDEVHVRQIINNFLSNAVKYTKEGQVILRLGYEETTEEQILLKIEVEDSGIGIKESDMDKLFLNFTRVDEQKNRNIQGTGLGLSLTKNLVELMDGE